MRGIEDSDVIRPTAHLDHAHFMVNSLLTRSPMTSITIHRECRLDPNLIVTCSHISIDRAHRNTTKKRYFVIAMLGGSNSIPFYRPVVLWCCAKRDSIPLRFMHQPRSSTLPSCGLPRGFWLLSLRWPKRLRPPQLNLTPLSLPLRFFPASITYHASQICIAFGLEVSSQHNRIRSQGSRVLVLSIAPVFATPRVEL
jgi:hypothetical protein